MAHRHQGGQQHHRQRLPRQGRNLPRYWYIQHRDKFCFYKGTSHTTEPHYKEAVETEISSMADLIFFRLTTDFPKITPEQINGAWE